MRAAEPGTRIAAGAVVALAAIPVAYLILRAAGDGIAEAFEVLSAPRTLGLLARTLALAIACAAAAVAIGAPLAILVERRAIRWRRTLSVLVSLPLAIPSYVFASTLIAFAGPHGLLADGIGMRLPSIYGFGGAFASITIATYPLVFLTVRAALRSIDPSIEEAARVLGDRPSRILRRVTWPAIRPAATAGGVLVALYAVHDFGAVALLRYDSFSRAIFVAYQGSFDRGRAAILALALVGVAVAITRLDVASRPATPRARVHGSASRPIASVACSRREAIVAGAGIVALLGVAVVMPIGVMVFHVLRSARGATAMPAMLEVAAATALVAGIAAVATVLAAWPVARASSRLRGRFVHLLEAASSVGYALPGIVVALALVLAAIRLAPAIYQTHLMLAVAYVVLFLPLATGALRAGFDHLPVAREHASRVLGRGRWWTGWRVVAPAMRPSALAAATLVALTAIKELPATMILSPPGFRTLSMRVFSETNAARFDQAALAALVLLAIGAVPLAIAIGRDRPTKPAA